MPAVVIDGKAIAENFRTELREKARRFTAESGVVPQLAAILVGQNPASEVYVRNKERACQSCGLTSTLHRLPEATTQDQLLQLIQVLNHDRSVHGILVQLPLPSHIQTALILDAVAPGKDVDCFHPENVGRMLQGRPRFLPCTPAGVMKLLEVSHIETAGRHAVILGRSDIVGKPMAALMMQRGVDSTVTICHSRTLELASLCRQADILIAAIGIPEFVTGDMIRSDAVVIDVGINRRDNRLVGDVDYAAAASKASAITPVPGGVGPMTIAMLLENTLTAATHVVK